MHVLLMDTEPSASTFLEEKKNPFPTQGNSEHRIQPLHIRLSTITDF